MEMAHCPNHLVFDGRGFNLAGVGRAPGSHAFMSPANGEVLEVFVGKVVSLGNMFASCNVANNGGLPSVRVDNHLANGWGPLQLGQVLLLALDFGAAGPRAKAAWPAQIKVRKQPMNVEKLGIISAVKLGFGFIRPCDGSPDAFFHFSEVRGFTPVVGMTVRCFAKFGPDGRSQAGNVRPA